MFTVAWELYTLRKHKQTYTQILLGPKKGRSVQVALPILWSDPLPDGLEFGAFVRVRGIGHYDTLPPDHKGAVAGLVNFSAEVRASPWAATPVGCARGLRRERQFCVSPSTKGLWYNIWQLCV